MSDDQMYLDALINERRGYAMYDKKDRLQLVDAEIARVKRALGVSDPAQPPQSGQAKQQRVTRRKED